MQFLSNQVPRLVIMYQNFAKLSRGILNLFLLDLFRSKLLNEFLVSIHKAEFSCLTLNLLNRPDAKMTAKF